jgi:hypothetical protein
VQASAANKIAGIKLRSVSKQAVWVESPLIYVFFKQQKRKNICTFPFHQNRNFMSRKLSFAILVMIASITIFSCGSNDKKNDGSKKNSETTIGPGSSGDGIVPKIDTVNLKDEASILKAIQQLVDARLANDKKQKEDPKAPSYFVEFTKLETAILNASTAYSKTLSDPNKSLEFQDKFEKIHGLLYVR